ncbi:MAG: DUF4349 domain-containing protein [Acidimicrobiales bacterium]
MSRRLLALFAAVMLLLAACSDADTDSDTSTDDAGGFDEVTTDPTPPPASDEAPDDRTDDRDMSDADGEAEGFGSDSTTADSFAQDEPADPGERPQAEVVPIFLGRQIIKTGEIVIEAADVGATTDTIIDTVFDNGGAIWGQETSTEPTPRAVLTIRVPPLDFDRLIAAITRVPGVGIVSESTTSDDVTEVVVDLDARIIAAESSVARVQALLDDARDLNTIFQLEEELATRQADLERLLGQRKTIGDQIALSTITLTILELDPDRLQPEVEVVAWLGTSADDACPGRSSLSMGADDTAVLCVSVNNTGEDTLTAIDVESPTLRLRVDDFEILDGVATLDEISPGDELLLTVELDAEGGSVNRVDVAGGTDIVIEVSATPATSDGLELTADDAVFLSAEGDDPLPGFGDSFSSGWDAMIAVVSILMIVVGALLPFVPIIALAVWLGRKYMISQRRRADERFASVEAPVASQAAAGYSDEGGASK